MTFAPYGRLVFGACRLLSVTTCFCAVLLPLPTSGVARASSTYPVFQILAKDNAGNWALGTGFYLRRPSGLWVITANHVVEGADPNYIFARVLNRQVRLVLARKDTSVDLAALRPEGELQFRAVRIRAGSATKGEVVTILGFPIPDVLGFSAATMVRGPVKDLDVTPGGIPGFFVAAPVGPGDSGAPVLDSDGQLIGVVIYALHDGAVAYAVHAFLILKVLGETVP